MTNEEALRILHCPSAYLTDEDSELAHTIPMFSRAYGQAMAVVFKSLEAWEKVKAEIKDKFGGCSICEWFEDYDYEENNVSEYMEIGRISDIIDIINKHLKEVQRNENNNTRL